VSQKISTFELFVTCQILNDFQNFCTAGKRMKSATNHILQYPPNRTYITTLCWEIKKSIFADMAENANKCRYFRCLKYGVFLVPTANKIFHVTVLLLIYYCDQFVASEICHSRCHCSVC